MPTTFPRRTKACSACSLGFFPRNRIRQSRGTSCRCHRHSCSHDDQRRTMSMLTATQFSADALVAVPHHSDLSPATRPPSLRPHSQCQHRAPSRAGRSAGVHDGYQVHDTTANLRSITPYSPPSHLMIRTKRVDAAQTIPQPRSVSLLTCRAGAARKKNFIYAVLY